MFLNISKFTNLTKKAYKTRLIIGDIADGLFIMAPKWSVWVKHEYVHNKIKAVVMELAGELPSYGEVFEVSKSNPEPQMVEKLSIIKMLQGAKEADQKLIVTPIVLNTLAKAVRLLQHHKDSTIIGVPEECFQMIDKNLIDLNIEGEPTGPCCTDYSNLIYWYNSIGIVFMLPSNIADKDKVILGALENVDFNKVCEGE